MSSFIVLIAAFFIIDCLNCDIINGESCRNGEKCRKGYSCCGLSSTCCPYGWRCCGYHFCCSLSTIPFFVNKV
uniref:Cysteine rich secreted protein n=1 Tax=Riptortus pedestris TaxID=329032 RepID=R4WP59_RIPPE|nr:cysteine rich secreted protein [Riptortus pedestris]